MFKLNVLQCSIGHLGWFVTVWKIEPDTQTQPTTLTLWRMYAKGLTTRAYFYWHANCSPELPALNRGRDASAVWWHLILHQITKDAPLSITAFRSHHDPCVRDALHGVQYQWGACAVTSTHTLYGIAVYNTVGSWSARTHLQPLQAIQKDKGIYI